VGDADGDGDGNGDGNVNVASQADFALKSIRQPLQIVSTRAEI